MSNTEPIAVTRISNQVFIILGILGAVFVGTAEWLLHFLPEGPGGEIDMLNHVPLERASRGHFIAVYLAPLYFAGYYGVMRIFKSSGYWLSRTILVLGIYSFSIGAIWISSRYFGALAFQTSMGSGNYELYITEYERHYQTIVWSLRISVILISLCYVLLILQNKIGWPKWMAIFNPAVLLAIIISSLFWLKPVGIHLAPIAMNAAHLIFFSLILYQYQKSSTLKL